MEPFPQSPPGADNPGATPSLVELHTRLLDTIAGFDKVVEKAEPDFRAIARDFRELHLRHAITVEEMLVRDGHDSAQDGSIFGAVNRGLIEIRSWFDRIDMNLMDALVQAEKHVLEAFEEAIAQAADNVRQTALATMRDNQMALMDRYCPPA